MKKAMQIAALCHAAILGLGAATGAEARSVREDAAGGYDFVVMKSIKVPTHDFPGVLRIVTNEFAGLLSEVPDLKTFETIRFDGTKKQIIHQGEDRTLVVVMGWPLPEYMRQDLTELFPDIEQGDFDRYNQGFSFSGVERERDNGEVTTVSFALLGNPDADTPVEAATDDRQRVYIRQGLELALPPGISFLTTQGLDRQGPGTTIFTGTVEMDKDEALQMLVESFRAGGVEPQINAQPDVTTISSSGSDYRANFMLRPIETLEDEPTQLMVQALISSQN